MSLCVHLWLDKRCLIEQVVRCRALVGSVGRGDYVGLFAQRPKLTASFFTRRGETPRAPKETLINSIVEANFKFA